MIYRPKSAILKSVFWGWVMRDDERRRRQSGDWRRRNLPSNLPQWYKDLDDGIWEFSKVFLIGLGIFFLLFFLFIVSVATS